VNEPGPVAVLISSRVNRSRRAAGIAETVRKVIRSEATDFRYGREQQQMPRLGAWLERLDELVAANEAAACAQTATR